MDNKTNRFAEIEQDTETEDEDDILCSLYCGKMEKEPVVQVRPGKFVDVEDKWRLSTNFLMVVIFVLIEATRRSFSCDGVYFDR